MRTWSHRWGACPLPPTGVSRTAQPMPRTRGGQARLEPSPLSQETLAATPRHRLSTGQDPTGHTAACWGQHPTTALLAPTCLTLLAPGARRDKPWMPPRLSRQSPAVAPDNGTCKGRTFSQNSERGSGKHLCINQVTALNKQTRDGGRNYTEADGEGCLPH